MRQHRLPRGAWRAASAKWPRLAVLALSALVAAACEQAPFEASSEDYAAAPRMALSSAFTGTIRIGVAPTGAAVSVGAPAGWELVERSTGNVVLTGTGGAVSISIQTPAQIVTVWRLQVICTTAENAAARVAAAAAGGYTAVTEVAPAGCTRVFIINTSGSDSFGSRSAFRTALIAQGHAGTDSFWGTIAQVSAAVLRAAGETTVSVREAAILRPTSGHVTINGLPYRGVAEVAPNSTGSLAGINVLPMEEYLYGVVPRELPPVPYGELEALKAQSVAARTYAMRGLGKRQADGYDLLPTTSDQVYGGMNAEHPLSTRAVDETAGVVARYNGALIEALYSSTSGGYTADNEEVYNSAPVPYLRGVPDANRGNAFANVPTLAVFKNHANARSLRGFKAGDYEADWSQYHRWTIDWTAEEMSQVVSVFAGRDVGVVHAVNVLERGPSGRVLRIEYVTDEGSFFDTKDRIRSSLRYFNANGVMSSLLSTLFFIEPVTEPGTGAVTGFIAYGGGWGHGVGLSQTGAVGMAEKKATYEEILLHYYRDITLDKVY
jgi:stage II sporulation protein D